MYCQKCGYEINDTCSFCPKCGQRVYSEPSVIPNAEEISIDTTLRQGPITKASIESIERLLDPLNFISLCRNSIYFWIQKRDKAKKKITPFFKPFLFSPLIWLFLLGTDNPRSLKSIAYAIVSLALMGGVYSLFFFLQKSHQKKIDGLLKDIDDTCATIDPEDMAVLPPSYRDYASADFLYHAFINQRATTMQEAVNLYEEQLFRDKSLGYQRKQYEKMLSIENSNAEISATMKKVFYDRF